MVLFGGWRYMVPKKYPPMEVVHAEDGRTFVIVPDTPINQPAPFRLLPSFVSEEDTMEEPEVAFEKEAGVTDLRAWAQYAASYEPAAGATGKIAIIIDDLGLDYKRTARVEALPAPLTLAYLPYAKRLKERTAKARARGHELLVHAPMEPISAEQNPGPLALLNDMDPAEVEVVLTKILDAFDGYVGINNHMGSRFTQNPEAMAAMMDVLAARGLVFVDSRTSAASVAGELAAQRDLSFATRDVFLDHEDTPEFVASALKLLEDKARENGYAVAIGHPKDATIAALEAWIPTLADKGLQLAPISAVVRR
jgi:polysaccharide deacetylase 2 family uncharacterized protein YibQ